MAPIDGSFALMEEGKIYTKAEYELLIRYNYELTRNHMLSGDVGWIHSHKEAIANMLSTVEARYGDVAYEYTD